MWLSLAAKRRPLACGAAGGHVRDLLPDVRQRCRASPRRCSGCRATPEDVQAQVAKLGLDRPLLVQYWDWLSRRCHGDLGRSFYTGESVTGALANRVPVTLPIVIITLLLTAVLSVLLGVAAAVRGGPTDRVVQIVSVAGRRHPGVHRRDRARLHLRHPLAGLPGHRLRVAGRERVRAGWRRWRCR